LQEFLLSYFSLKLSCVGDFYQKPKDQPMNGERAKPIRQEDNLHPEGKNLEAHAQVHVVNF